MIQSESILRILDANFNRAREALRTLEDFARFVLDDALLTEACKALRHDLSAAIPQFGPLVESRDIVGDVGREVTAAGEYTRQSPAHVALAAAKRLSEALRSIEEYGKTIDSKGAGEVEALRYRGYELERRVAGMLRAAELFGAVRLYVILTESLCRHDWLVTAEGALAGGADCLQLREKDLPDAELLRRACRLTELCRSRDKLCIINDRADIAAASMAHGVHLGQEDLPVAEARRILPPGAVIGVSTHDIGQFETGATAAPDYLAVGPMFPSRTKPQDRVPGPELLRATAARTSLPVVAIGGIDESNVALLLKITPVAICVCSAVIAAPDPQAAARQLRHRIDTLCNAEAPAGGTP